MKPVEWIAAWRRGEVEHDWAEITVEAGGHAARFRVSAQPLKAAGVTRSIGARGLQRMADLIVDERGRPSLLLTDKLADERRRQATVVLDPLVGDIRHITEEQSSEWIWWALANNCAHMVSGQWLVAGGWKIFTLDRRCTPTSSVNRGFYVGAENVVAGHFGGHYTRGLPTIQGRPGANGIPCYPTTAQGLYAIQVQGTRLHGVAQSDDGAGDQDDYCLAPGTRILKTDLSWMPVDALRPGDELIGFDEQLGRDCRLRPSVVEATSILEAPTFEVRTDRGAVVASADHRWVVEGSRRYKGGNPGRRWVRTADLRPGDQISRLCAPWEQDSSWSGAWLAGLLDGEGWVSGSSAGFGQNPGGILSRALELLADAGFTLHMNANRQGCMRVLAGGPRGGMRLVGTYRPFRLLEKSRRIWEGRAPWGRGSRNNAAVVQAIVDKGSQTVHGLRTSTRTLIAEGMLSHNSQKGEILGGTCWIRRAGAIDWIEMATAAVLTDPEPCVLAVGDGKALPFTRLPGVPVLDPNEQAPDTLPPPASNGPRELPSVRTPCTPAELYAALARVAPDLERKSLLVLLAQWSLETAEGRQCRAWNLGNAKGRPDGSDGRSWQYFSCNEILPAAVAARIFAAAAPRKDGPGPSAAITSTRPNGDVIVWFYPNHPYACFRAFATLDEGASDYVQMQRTRFASAWPAVLAGDPAAFGHALKLAHYYTAGESGYVGDLQRLYQRYEATV